MVPAGFTIIVGFLKSRSVKFPQPILIVEFAATLFKLPSLTVTVITLSVWSGSTAMFLYLMILRIFS